MKEAQDVEKEIDVEVSTLIYIIYIIYISYRKKELM